MKYDARMVRSSVMTLSFVVAACANGNSAPSPSGSRGSAATAASPRDASTKPPMTKPTFDVANDQDLKVALLAAVSDAEKSGAGELTVRIAPGTYKHPLQLRAATDPRALSFVVEPSGPGTVVLGGGISITGKSIRIRGVVVDGANTPASTLSLNAFETLEVQGVALVGAKVGSGRGERDPLIDLVARAPKARAQLRDVWIVDSTTGQGAVIRIPVNGPGRWASVELDNVAMVGNRAKVGIDARATDALTLRDMFVAEPALAGPWLQIGTYGSITVDQSVVAVKGELVDHYETSEGGYPKVVVTASEILGPRPGKAIDARDTKVGKLPAQIDVSTAAAAARAGKPPERAALRAALP